ncbi:hypothetical protein N182_18105 [Sinorhizobium sp. GL2]|nr:hypothetical protein N182_18105 [Sinorhizobium sp. GL2]
MVLAFAGWAPLALIVSALKPRLKVADTPHKDANLSG